MSEMPSTNAGAGLTRRQILVFGILGTAVVAGFGGWRVTRRGGESGASVALARNAPDIQAADDRGRPFHLQSLKGQVVLVHFWASWCPPCLEEIPNFLKLAESYAGKPIKFIAVSLDEGWDEAKKTLAPDAHGDNLISVLDQTKLLPDRYGTYQYPETYLLSKDLGIITKWVGGQNWESPLNRAAIERAFQ